MEAMIGATKEDERTGKVFRLVGWRKKTDGHDHYDVCWHDLTESEARDGGWQPLWILDAG